ncbi:hypothetical protein T484DRAFT_1912530 [Baffinella frigidus]|nr:hypothetical protein T484DRAFT_1912530 [Cryptophyta sp. CCMP2293]
MPHRIAQPRALLLGGVARLHPAPSEESGDGDPCRVRVGYTLVTVPGERGEDGNSAPQPDWAARGQRIRIADQSHS